MGRPRFDIRQAGQSILLVLGALALVNLVGYALFTRPQIRAYEALRKDSEPGFSVLEKRRAQVEHHEAFLSAVERAEKDLEKLRDEILSSRDTRLVEVQDEVARLAAEFHIPLESVGFSSELLVKEELDRFGMDVPLEGNYTSLRKFLQAVEQSDKFLVVERVALARGKEGGNLLSLSISLATYFNAPEGTREFLQQRREARNRSRGQS